MERRKIFHLKRGKDISDVETVLKVEGRRSVDFFHLVLGLEYLNKNPEHLLDYISMSQISTTTRSSVSDNKWYITYEEEKVG